MKIKKKGLNKQRKTFIFYYQENFIICEFIFNRQISLLHTDISSLQFALNSAMF